MAMMIPETTGYRAGEVQEMVGVSMLDRSMNFQRDAVMRLLESLPAVQDPMLGNNIDTYA
ncbi:MAG TPA: putative motility protein [Spirochaetia bacterium]|nr:putative motility protein [Spirochaetia bacterium]